jgi:hypothetical protein
LAGYPADTETSGKSFFPSNVFMGTKFKILKMKLFIARKGTGFTSLIFILVFRIKGIFKPGKPNQTEASRNS